MKLPVLLLSFLTIACARPSRPSTTPAAVATGSTSTAVPSAPHAGSFARRPDSGRPAADAPAPTCRPASGRNALPPLRQTSSAEIVARHGSGLEAYSREGGRWLPQLPVLVNEEFDFATAMGLSAIGAGVAARNRMDHNREKADALSRLAPPSPLEQRLDALRRCGLHAYFLLWGTDQPVLKLVVDDLSEADSPGTEPPHHVVEGARRPLRGADGWSQPDNLADEMLRLLEQNRQARVSAVSKPAWPDFD